MVDLTWEDIGVITIALAARRRVLQFTVTATHATPNEREDARAELGQINSILSRKVRLNDDES